MPRALLLKFSAVVAYLVLACANAAAEPIVFERDSALLAQPRQDASVAANVKRGTTGDATTRNGVWVNVKTAAGSGWVLSFNVRYGAASSGGGVDTSLAQRLTGPSQKLAVSSTIGIRGVDKEDLRAAQFDAQQVRALEQYRTTDAQAKATAAASGLRAVDVDYLDKR